MALTLYGLRDYPNDFPVTKTDAPWEECSFVLDFSRPLRKLRWFGVHNKWIGITVGLMVPVAHITEEQGGFLIGVGASDPYFKDLKSLWKKHYGYAAQRGIVRQPGPMGGLEIIADFGRHFPIDGAPPF